MIVDGGSMTTNKKIVQIIVTGILLAASTSCLIKTLSEDDVLGLWTESIYSSSFEKGVECASIEFFKNGRFEAHNLPKDYFPPTRLPIDPTVRVNASGKWKFGSIPADPLKNRTVNLIFTDPDALYNNGLMFITTIGEPMLYWGGELPIEAVVFTKNEDEWCKKEP